MVRWVAISLAVSLQRVVWEWLAAPFLTLAVVVMEDGRWMNDEQTTREHVRRVRVGLRCYSQRWLLNIYFHTNQRQVLLDCGSIVL